MAKKALIEARKEQYAIKSARQPVIGRSQKAAQQPKYISKPPLEGFVTFDENGYCVPHGISLVDPKVCSAILCNYSLLHTSSKNKFDSDLWGLMEEFDKLMDKALAPYPIYKTLVQCKIAEKQNIEIQEELMRQHGQTHSLEYISSLWRKKIPDIIASQAEDDYLY